MTGSGLPLIIHLKIPRLFPDFSLIFYSFPYPLTDKKKSFLFSTLMVLIVSLFGVTLTGKNLLPMGTNSFL